MNDIELGSSQVKTEIILLSEVKIELSETSEMQNESEVPAELPEQALKENQTKVRQADG